MGLDSVMLLVNFEEYFQLQVPDMEAEKIRTVQEMVDYVVLRLNIQEKNSDLQDALFEKLKTIFTPAEKTGTQLRLSDKIAPYLPAEDKEAWNNLAEVLSLQLPVPFVKKESFFQKTFSLVWSPKYEWKDISVEQFIIAVCANNYERLLNRYSFKSTFEIMVAVCGITSDKLGVDIYEIQAEKSFTQDFGID